MLLRMGEGEDICCDSFSKGPGLRWELGWPRISSPGGGGVLKAGGDPPAWETPSLGGKEDSPALNWGGKCCSGEVPSSYCHLSNRGVGSLGWIKTKRFPCLCSPACPGHERCHSVLPGLSWVDSACPRGSDGACGSWEGVLQYDPLLSRGPGRAVSGGGALRTPPSLGGIFELILCSSPSLGSSLQ